MKLVHLSAFVLAGTFTVLAIGCAKTKDNSGKKTPTHNYKLQESCDAKPFISTSPDQDCATIQAAIASGCAVEKRQALYDKRCTKKTDSTSATTTTTLPVFDDKDKKETTTTAAASATDLTDAEKQALLADDTVTAQTKTTSTTTTVKASEKASTLLKTVVLDDNKEFVASIKLSAVKENSKLEFLSAPTAIRCADDLELAKQDIGVILVGDGKLVVTRDMNMEISEDQEETPAVQIECISTAKEKSKETLGLTAKALKVGQMMSDTTLGYSKKDVQSKMSVSCHEDATKAALSGQNGIQILKGTTVLLNNDLNKQMSLISCQ